MSETDVVDFFPEEEKIIDKNWIPKYSWNIESAIQEALNEGMEVTRSTPTTLLLDLDTAASVIRYEELFGIIADQFQLSEWTRYVSRSGNGVHIILKCRELDFPSRVALQAALGSDPLREILAIAMYKAGYQEPSVLFRPKEKICEIAQS
jgi:hypothetical protein